MRDAVSFWVNYISQVTSLMFPLFVCILFFFSFHQSLVLVFLLFSSIVRSIRLSLFVRRSCTQTYCVCWCFSVLHTCTHHDHHIITISTISKNDRDNKPLQFDRMLNNGRADYAGGSKLDKAGRRHGFLLFFFFLVWCGFPRKDTTATDKCGYVD